MMKIRLFGRSGRMGTVIESLVNERDDMEIVEENEDIIIDFSHFSQFEKVLETAVADGVPLIVGTTALTEEHHRMIDEAAEKIPVLQSANMSLGINLLSSMLEQITPVLAERFDIAVLEKHHTGKKDAPSGTALLLKRCIEENGGDNVAVNAVRGGTIPGEHTVSYMGLDEIIEIRHEALSRKIFAQGALVAAEFMAEAENGRYSMRDVLGV